MVVAALKEVLISLCVKISLTKRKSIVRPFVLEELKMGE